MDAPRFLTFMSGPRDGETIEIDWQAEASGVLLGRLATCTVCLPDDPEVSRNHARLSTSKSGCTLEDLDSANGTFVGEFRTEERVKGKQTIQPGQIFRVGRTRFQLDSAMSDSARALAFAAAAR